MIALMKTNDEKAEGGQLGKVAVHSRVAPDILAKLDQMGAERRPAVSRSLMIELAIIELVERNKVGRSRKA
jgi:hypothetical protein